MAAYAAFRDETTEAGSWPCALVLQGGCKAWPCPPRPPPYASGNAYGMGPVARRRTEMRKHRDTPSYGWSARAIVDTSSRLYFSCSEKGLVDSHPILLATCSGCLSYSVPPEQHRSCACAAPNQGVIPRPGACWRIQAETRPSRTEPAGMMARLLHFPPTKLGPSAPRAFVRSREDATTMIIIMFLVQVHWQIPRAPRCPAMPQWNQPGPARRRHATASRWVQNRPSLAPSLSRLIVLLLIIIIIDEWRPKVGERSAGRVVAKKRVRLAIGGEAPAR
jgi:hypothetical protein